MASLRQIRRRIRSIQSTKQIMRAMQLVAGSKFKRAQARLLQGRQMLQFLDELLQRVLAAAPAEFQHPLTQANAQAPSTLVIVTSDTGLAGSYNTNLIQLAEAELRKDTAKTTQIVYLGKKGHRYFTKRGFAAKDAILDQGGRPEPVKIDAFGKLLMERFLSGQTSGVRLLYAKFQSSTVSRPTVKQWLPITVQAVTEDEKALREEYIFEPSAQRVLEDLLPRWAIAAFRLSLLEAFTAEHSARMIAMKNATDNAQELLTSLTRERNKIRQASITKELSEIVGTVEALK